ncbi:MAG: type II toxin-antitoxin system Phd/YefM family antitoxin [Acidiferrobacter sp.]
MPTYNIHYAKTHLSQLVAATQRGAAIVIAKAGKPVAMLGPIKKAEPVRIRGLLKGQIRLSPKFDEPLPEDLLEAFEGTV